MDNAKAMKLLRLIDLLAPSIAGDIRDIDEAIAASLRSPDSRLEAPFDANCPLHILLKDISVNVIDFLKSIPKIAEEHTPRDKMCYFVTAYPVLRGFPLQLVVQSPQVTVADVPYKGKGVFATKNIPANRIVTFYPIDIIRIRQYDPPLKEGYSAIFVKSTKHQNLASTCGGVEDAFGEYKFSIANVDIYGDPEIYSDGCCGHLVNDGNGPIQGTNNCVLHPLFGGVCLAVITLCDIGKGEELLLPYGPHYWTCRSKC